MPRGVKRKPDAPAINDPDAPEAARVLAQARAAAPLQPAAKRAHVSPKYLVNRTTGQVLPYNEQAAKWNPDLVPVAALPTEYVRKQQELRDKRTAEARARAAYIEQYRADEIARETARTHIRAARSRVAVSPETDEAQNRVNAINDPGAFDLSTADESELREFAKDALGTDLPEAATIDELRAEIQRLMQGEAAE